jgi:hypothetical protein
LWSGVTTLVKKESHLNTLMIETHEPYFPPSGVVAVSLVVLLQRPFTGAPAFAGYSPQEA